MFAKALFDREIHYNMAEELSTKNPMFTKEMQKSEVNSKEFHEDVLAHPFSLLQEDQTHGAICFLSDLLRNDMTFPGFEV